MLFEPGSFGGSLHRVKFLIRSFVSKRFSALTFLCFVSLCQDKEMKARPAGQSTRYLSFASHRLKTLTVTETENYLPVTPGIDVMNIQKNPTYINSCRGLETAAPEREEQSATGIPA